MSSRARRLLWAAACASLATGLATAVHAVVGDDSIQSLVDAIVQARGEGRPPPRVSAAMAGLDLDDAYAIQRGVVAARAVGDPIAGFKAAATSPTAQAQLGSDGPVFGVLFDSGRRATGETLALDAFHSAGIEIELGFTFTRRLAAPVESAEALQGLVHRVHRVVEVPDVGFAPAEGLRVVDVVAANVGSSVYVVGDDLGHACRDVNAIAVRLREGDEVVSRGESSDPLGDQWKALQWTVNEAIRGGYTIELGQLVITGSLGPMTPARRGAFVADFGVCGLVDLRFE